MRLHTSHNVVEDRNPEFGVENLAGTKSTRTPAIWGEWTIFLLSLVFALVVGCSGPGSTPTLVPTLTPSAIPATPTPTATPIPTPTATPTLPPTPIPPLHLSIEFPRPVTALEPVPMRVLVEEPPGIDAHARLSARVVDAQDQLYATFDMVRENEDGWWVADGELQLPLEPEPYPGVWHFIVDVQADLPIRGYRDRVFTPQRVPYHVLTDTLPLGVELRVPQAFTEVAVQGNPVAGLHTWRYRDCEVTLAWAPGPTERLLGDNALVMAEAVHDPQYEITIEESVEMTWGEEERIAFLFQERWRNEGRRTPAETLVVQGPDYRLYALRIRALEKDEIHPLCQDVRDTWGFAKD